MNARRLLLGTAHRSRRLSPGPTGSHDDSWWPWALSPHGVAPCTESVVVVDAFRRLVTATGKLQACCVEKMTRVADFVLDIAPGDTSIDLTGVTLLEPPIALVVVAWRNRLAALNSRLSIVGASPASRRALGLNDTARVAIL